MDRKDLEALEARMMKIVVQRRQLGSYNSEAETILLLSETVYDLVRHLREKAPRPKDKE